MNKVILITGASSGMGKVTAEELIKEGHTVYCAARNADKMKDLEVYPFMLVLSCYNGYFDLPGELSMAEGLLRANGRGIVAMLSATRLTYGSGNIALNELLFEGIFEEKILRIGQLTAISKTRLLINEGLNWLNQMQERYADEGLKVIAINLDKNKAHAKKFLEMVPAEFDIAYDPEGEVADLYSLKVMPSSYIIDREGNLIHAHKGFKTSDGSRMEDMIRDLLKDK